MKTRPKIDKKELHTVWAKAVKDRDGWRCQLCGRDLAKMGGHANAHHIAGKKSTLLRFSLDNGICLCQGCHKFGVHSPDGIKSREMVNRIEQIVGPERWGRIMEMKNATAKQSIVDAQEALCS